MSSDSLNDSHTKYLTKSLSQNDGSRRSDSYSNSIRSTEDKSSIGSIEGSSIYENSPSTRSMRIQISPISTAVNSTKGKIESSTTLEDILTSTQLLQTESDSFESHTYPNYDQKVDLYSNRSVVEQLTEDLQLPLAEEQDASSNACRNVNQCAKKGLGNDRDPIENLVSATLAFKEASNKQCDLIRAQTSAINRLASAIEDQNIMMSRFHNIAQKTATENVQDNSGH